MGFLDHVLALLVYGFWHIILPDYLRLGGGESLHCRRIDYKLAHSILILLFVLGG